MIKLLKRLLFGKPPVKFTESEASGPARRREVRTQTLSSYAPPKDVPQATRVEPSRVASRVDYIDDTPYVAPSHHGGGHSSSHSDSSSWGSSSSCSSSSSSDSSCSGGGGD